MRSRDAIVEKVVKVLRLARGAGTEEEAHAALLGAQRMMYEHGIDEREVADFSESEAVVDLVVDRSGRRRPWREYLAAVVAENFRCAFVISRSRGSGETRLVFLGRGGDAAVAREAFGAAAHAAEALARRCADGREPHLRDGAREAFLAGFVAGLYDRFRAGVASGALAVRVDEGVVRYAERFVNAGEAAGGGLRTGDGEALREGYDSGYDFGDPTRRLDG